MPILYNIYKKKGFFRIPVGGTQTPCDCSFSYSAASYKTSDSDPTPTITGDAGGVFSSTVGLVINSATGEITLATSTVASYVVTYTVCGSACTQNLEVTAGAIANLYSMEFDGIDDYIGCGNISALNGVTNATWIGWFNRDAAGSFYMMSTWGTTSATKQFAPLQTATSLNVYMANSAGAQQTMFTHTSLTFTAGTWYHLAFVYDEAEVSNADKMKVYINGVVQVNAAAGAALTTLNAATSDFEIGKLGGYTTNEFNGKIDEVAVWDSALGVDDITAIYNDTSTGKTADLSLMDTPPVAWYRMGD